MIPSDVVLIVTLHGLPLGFVIIGFSTCMCVCAYDSVAYSLGWVLREEGRVEHEVCVYVCVYVCVGGGCVCGGGGGGTQKCFRLCDVSV